MEVKNSASNVIRDLPRTGISDKLDHAIGGTIAFCTFSVGMYVLAKKAGVPSPELIAAVAGLIGTCAAALFLELFLKYTHSGVASWSDFFYTVAPAALFSGLIFFLR